MRARKHACWPEEVIKRNRFFSGGHCWLGSRGHGISIISHCERDDRPAYPVDSKSSSSDHLTLTELHNNANHPLVAIVGRPNVGKSTLFNRLVGSRRAIVGDEPGITRDRLYGKTEWRGRDLQLVDTGGIVPEDKDLIPSEIFRRARIALDEAAAIVMVVDGRTEIAGPDLELARLLQRTGKPLFLAVNKIDTEKQQALSAEFHALGIHNLFPVSAENGNGLDDLLDAVIAELKLEPAPSEEPATSSDSEETEDPGPA